MAIPYILQDAREQRSNNYAKELESETTEEECIDMYLSIGCALLTDHDSDPLLATRDPRVLLDTPPYLRSIAYNPGQSAPSSRTRYEGKRHSWKVQQYHTKRSFIDNKPLPALPKLLPIPRPEPEDLKYQRRSWYNTLASPLNAQTKTSRTPDHSYPVDRGTMAWLHVLCGHLLSYNCQGLQQSFGVFQAYYETVLLPDKSASTISWIGSIQIFLAFALCIATSPLMAKGHFRLCFNGGSLLLFVATFLISLCKEYWHFFLVQGILTGLGMGLMFGSGLVVLMSWFPNRVAIATGLASCGGAIGGMIYPAIADRLVPKIGFAWTMRVIALIVALTMIPANLIARERPESKLRRQQQAARQEKAKVSSILDLPFILFFTGVFFMFWGIYIGFYYIVIYAQSHVPDISPSESIYLLIWLNAANMPGRLLPPLLASKWLGPVGMIIPCALLSGFFLFLWIGSVGRTGLIMIICAYGLAAGGVQSLYSSAVAEISRDGSARQDIQYKTDTTRRVWYRGGKTHQSDQFVEPSSTSNEAILRSRLAIVLLGIGLATLTGSPLGGALIAKMNGGYLGAQLFAGGSVWAGGLLVLGAKFARARKIRVGINMKC